jgi:hypothetical protein
MKNILVGNNFTHYVIMLCIKRRRLSPDILEHIFDIRNKEKQMDIRAIVPRITTYPRVHGFLSPGTQSKAFVTL